MRACARACIYAADPRRSHHRDRNQEPSACGSAKGPKFPTSRLDERAVARGAPRGAPHVGALRATSVPGWNAFSCPALDSAVHRDRHTTSMVSLHRRPILFAMLTVDMYPWLWAGAAAMLIAVCLIVLGTRMQEGRFL